MIAYMDIDLKDLLLSTNEWLSKWNHQLTLVRKTLKIIIIIIVIEESWRLETCCHSHSSEKTSTNADVKNYNNNNNPPNYRIVRIGQNTEKCPRNLKNLLVIQNTVKDHQLTLVRNICIEAKMIMEKCRCKQKNPSMAWIDKKNSFDCIPHE